MQQSSLIKFISVGILATGVMVVPMTSPAFGQVTTPNTGSQGTTTTNYDNNRNDNSSLWGLSGLVGLGSIPLFIILVNNKFLVS